MGAPPDARGRRKRRRVAGLRTYLKVVATRWPLFYTSTAAPTRPEATASGWDVRATWRGGGVAILDRAEQFLERLVEGTIMRFFRRPVQPAEIGRKLERAMEDSRVA